MRNTEIYSFSPFKQAIECGLVRQRAILFEKKIEENRIMKEEIKLGTTLRRTTKMNNVENSSTTVKENKNKVNSILQQNLGSNQNLGYLRTTISSELKKDSKQEGLLATVKPESRPASLYLPSPSLLKKNNDNVSKDENKTLKDQTLGERNFTNLVTSNQVKESSLPNDLVISPSSSEDTEKDSNKKNENKTASENIANR